VRRQRQMGIRDSAEEGSGCGHVSSY